MISEEEEQSAGKSETLKDPSVGCSEHFVQDKTGDSSN
jgi:hypothetical protein